MAQVTLITLKAGEKFNYGGVEWIALEQQDGKAICLAADTLDDKPFDKNGCNNWAESSLRKYLNGTFLNKLTADGGEVAAFLEFTTDLTTDDGMPNYGESKDKVSLLTCDQYRKYRRAGVLTMINKWWWTATAWTASNAHYVRSVNTSGALDDYNANYGSIGVRPLCNLTSSILVSVD